MIGAILLAGNRHRFFQLAFDGINAGKHLGDVLVCDLVLEIRVRHRLRAREPVLNREHAKEQQVPDEPDRRGHPTWSAFRRLPFWKSLRPPWSCGRLPGRWHGRWRLVRRVWRRWRALRSHVFPFAPIRSTSSAPAWMHRGPAVTSRWMARRLSRSRPRADGRERNARFEYCVPAAS